MSPDRLRHIIHLDMDAFYAAVEVLDHPELAGRPVIVGGLGPRGVVSTASYEARTFGVHSAMPTAEARRLCPGGVYLPTRPGRYVEISQKIMAIFKRYTPLVEPLSLDEAFLDVTGSLKLFGPAEAIARRLKREVKNETRLTVTAGVATQKHLAKIASGLHKPDGLTIVPPGEELDFLWPLPLKELWGVGRAALGRLTALGLTTIGDLAALDGDFLEKRFGQTGRHFWRLANGLDEREVTPDAPPKSVGAETTFPRDLAGREEKREAVLAQALEAARRLRGKRLAGRTVTVKLRDGRFKTITRAKTLPWATDRREEIIAAALELYEKEAAIGPLRLVGVTVSQLAPATPDQAPAPPRQLELFGPAPAENDERGQKLNRALDQIEGRFGAGKIKPATLK